MSVCLCVRLLVTFVGPAITDELIEMPFGWVTLVGPIIPILDGGLYPPKEMGTF